MEKMVRNLGNLQISIALEIKMSSPCELYRIWVDGKNGEKPRKSVEVIRHWYFIFKSGCA